MSTIADTEPRSATRVNLRSYLAGGTATTALIAGAVIIFVSLAAYVAFNGLPTAGGPDSDDTVLVGPSGSGAPAAAASALAAAPGAVAATPAAPTPVAPPPIVTAGVSVPPPGISPLVAPPPEGPSVTPPGEGPAPAPGTSGGDGALGGTVDGLESTADDLGLDLPLQETTDPITGPLDETLNETLNEAGGLLGQPGLGDDVDSGLNSVTQGLLGPGGVTDQLLDR